MKHKRYVVIALDSNVVLPLVHAHCGRPGHEPSLRSAFDRKCPHCWLEERGVIS